MTEAPRESPVPEHAAGTDALGALKGWGYMSFVRLMNQISGTGWFRSVLSSAALGGMTGAPGREAADYLTYNPRTDSKSPASGAGERNHVVNAKEDEHEE